MVSENQNRMALVPELLAVVKKPYDEEQSAFKQLQEARAEVGKLQLSVETFNDTQELVKYQQAQTNLSSSLATVIEISNRYPALSSDAVFQDLLATIDAQEQKITLART
ncbi:LemA family protein, partial [Pseudoalteromonas sp. SIMBA_148]